MDEGLVILSSPGVEEYVSCSSQHVKTQGQLFKKQIFKWGEFSHPANPNYKINVDRNFYSKLKKNFDDGVCPIVQFPLVDSQNRHVESPESNLGVVVDMSDEEDGVYVYLDVRKHQEDVGKVILGASAKLSLDYTDTRTNKKVGPTLLHVAATNRPYLVDLNDFETVSASNADTTEDNTVLLLSGGDCPENPKQEEKSMTKEELIVALSEFGVDVVAGQQALADVEGFVSLSSILGDDLVATPETLSTTIVDLTNSINDRDSKIADQESRIQTLTAQVQEINLSAATAEVDTLITQGRIRPVTKDVMVDLAMNDRERFEVFLIPEEEAKLELSEQGFTSSESTLQEDPAARAKAEGTRLANLTK